MAESKIDIFLTSDYEVWGDGTGDIKKCLINPAEEMMKVAERYNARITFFFDVCEYWAFSEVERKGGYNAEKEKPSELIKNQLQDAIKRGHDVQLHFHPQWLNYEFISDQKWILDMDLWRLPEVDKVKSTDYTIDQLFQKGKETLEELFKPIDYNYSVKAFRAGAWCIQPEDSIIKAMKAHDITIDSSVAPGRKYDDGRTIYNFKNCPNKPFWTFDKSVTTEGQSQLIELPIYTQKIPLIKLLKFKYGRFKRKKKWDNEKATYLVAKSKVEVNKSRVVAKIKNVLNPYHMFNYSDFSGFFELKEMFLLAERDSREYFNSRLPVVLISHPKTIHNTSEFAKFMKWVSQKKDANFQIVRNFHSD